MPTPDGGQIANSNPLHADIASLRVMSWRAFIRAVSVLPFFAVMGCSLPNEAPPSSELSSMPLSASKAQITDQAFIADDGRALPLRMWLPEDIGGKPQVPKAVIVAVHGFNDHNTAFEMPAEIWQRQGIATVAYDQRGFGANLDRGIWAGTETLTQDLNAAVRAVRLRYPETPVYALGESMGGAVVLNAAGEKSGPETSRPDGIILVAPALWARKTMPIYQRAALWAAVRIIPAMTFTGQGFKVQPSDNIPMLRALGHDPLFIKATRVDAIWGLANLMDEAFDIIPKVRCDALLLYGAHDELIPKDAMRQGVREIQIGGKNPMRTAYYPNGWHMLLRDLEYRVVAEDVAHWIFDHAAPLPSGADLEATIFFKYR